MRLFILLVILAGIQLVPAHLVIAKPKDKMEDRSASGFITGIIGKTCTKNKECNSISYCWKPEFGFTSSIDRIQRCKSKCGLHGGTYNYCYVSRKNGIFCLEKNWDICTPSQETGDPHCFPKTDHLLWIGGIIAVFIGICFGICIFYCRKRYKITRANVKLLGVVDLDIEKRNQDNETPPNDMAANQNSPSSMECDAEGAINLEHENVMPEPATVQT